MIKKLSSTEPFYNIEVRRIQLTNKINEIIDVLNAWESKNTVRPNFFRDDNGHFWYITHQNKKLIRLCREPTHTWIKDVYSIESAVQYYFPDHKLVQLASELWDIAPKEQQSKDPMDDYVGDEDENA